MFELTNPAVLKSDEAAPTNHQTVDGAVWEQDRYHVAKLDGQPDATRRSHRVSRQGAIRRPNDQPNHGRRNRRTHHPRQGRGNPSLV